MSKLIISTLLFIILLAPTSPVSAQTERQEALLAQLQSLLSQLASLKQQLSERQSAQRRVAGQRTSRLIPSKYYHGDYVAIYFVKDNKLIPYGRTIANNHDRELWRLFSDVVGEAVVNEHITEFRIYNDKKAKFDAFVEQIEQTENWMVGVNIASVSVENQPEKQSTMELFIHEYAHFLFYYEDYIREKFKEKFWRGRSHNSHHFVSDYAMTNSEEDFAESFTHFVLYPKPTGNLLRNEKVLLFYNYESMRDLRAEIRARLFN